MNKRLQHITMADVTRCKRAILAISKIRGLRQVRKYQTALQISDFLTDQLQRLKLFYAAQVGVVLFRGAKLMPREVLREMIGEANRLYAYGYPAPKIAEWRSEIIKPISITIERVDWLEKQEGK